MQHFIAIVEFKLELQSGNALFGWKSAVFVQCDLEIWRMTLTNNRAYLIFYFKLCATLQRYRWIQTGITVWKHPIWPYDLEIWWMTLKNNIASLLYSFKLCATIHRHQWMQTGVTVRKRPIWVKIDDFLSRVTLKFDGWPWKNIEHLSYATSSCLHHP